MRVWRGEDRDAKDTRSRKINRPGRYKSDEQYRGCAHAEAAPTRVCRQRRHSACTATCPLPYPSITWLVIVMRSVKLATHDAQPTQ
jgi:hypothetical protein